VIEIDLRGTKDGVLTRIDKARAHYAAAGLGENYVEQFIR